MFHFLKDKSKVYIGICDWDMTTISKEPMKSLYTFTSAKNMEDALRKRWWVDPSIAYLHKRDADVQIILNVSCDLEEYAISKLAQRINKHCISRNYHRLQCKTPKMTKFAHDEFGRVFNTYLGQLTQKSLGPHGGLSHIITQFLDTHN